MAEAIQKRERERRCQHNRRPSRCKECGGASICQHGRIRSRCADCGGSNICSHGKVLSRCRQCKGGKETPPSNKAPAMLLGQPGLDLCVTKAADAASSSVWSALQLATGATLVPTLPCAAIGLDVTAVPDQLRMLFDSPNLPFGPPVAPIQCPPDLTDSHSINAYAKNVIAERAAEDAKLVCPFGRGAKKAPSAARGPQLKCPFGSARMVASSGRPVTRSLQRKSFDIDSIAI